MLKLYLNKYLVSLIISNRLKLFNVYCCVFRNYILTLNIQFKITWQVLSILNYTNFHIYIFLNV